MNIIHEILRGVWFIEPNYAQKYIPMVAALLKGQANQNLFQEQNNQPKQFSPQIINNTPVVSAYDLMYFPEEIKNNSIFNISIAGPITKYDQFCGPMGMRTAARLLKMADDHPNVYAHVVSIDSGGGEGYAGRMLANQISRLKKPVVGFADDFSCSAAYMIASATDHVVANSNMARIGSIGTYISIVDYSEYFKKEGIKITDVYADQSADKNQDYIKALKGDTSQITKLANAFNDFFLDSIIQNRDSKLTSDEWKTGKVFFADQAKDIGLIDDIASFDELISSMTEQYIH